ncbi:unnamed protein product [Caenorhabditis bovis]|uniref:Uncharacterized protein n=1 Tax=Caenorhabditis bovis TaxID=2654633 RepID=A0A8S1ERN6_9PELO|nr:unnamed protein product [Caenorhabditis bovis]
MEVVDSAILSSFLHFTNYIASKSNLEKVDSLAQLWKEHGRIVSSLLECDVTDFESSSMFYNVLCKKLRHTNSAMTEELNVSKAADGDLMEICKFYALFLEHMRKDNKEILTKLLENCSTSSAFRIDAILQMFAHFDKLYENETVDGWWTILRQEIDEEPTLSITTPTSRRTTLHRDIFTTPASSTHRMRTVCSTSRRSPVVDAVDSPTMKYLRAEREMTRLKKRLADTEIKLDDATLENSNLLAENLQLKNTISDLRSNIADRKNDVASNEEIIEDLENRLKTKSMETEKLAKSFNEARQNILTLMNQLEAAENMNAQANSAHALLQKENEQLMLELRDVRDLHYTDMEKSNSKISELMNSIAEGNAELHRSQIEVGRLNMECSTAHMERQSLTEKVNGLQMELEMLQQKLMLSEENSKSLQDGLQKQLEEEKKDRIAAVQAEIERTKMAQMTVERLKIELDGLKTEKLKLKEVLDSIDQSGLMATVKNHEQNENFTSVVSCLEAAKRKIELLEVNLSSKEANVATLNQQFEDISKMLDTEKKLRKRSEESSSEMIAKLEEKVKNYENKFMESSRILDEKCESLKKEHAEKINDLTVELEVLQETLASSEETMRKLANEKMCLEEELEDLRKRMHSMQIRLGDNDKENTLTQFEEDEKLQNLVDESLKYLNESPKKAVFSNCEESMEQRESMPPGLRITNMSSVRRESFAPDSAPRNSILRSSSRSECASTPHSVKFKAPFTPGETNRERLNELAERNKMVPPHIRSSYATETFSLSSPSADEAAIKGEEKKKRRKSLMRFRI